MRGRVLPAAAAAAHVAAWGIAVNVRGPWSWVGLALVGMTGVAAALWPIAFRGRARAVALLTGLPLALATVIFLVRESYRY